MNTITRASLIETVERVTSRNKVPEADVRRLLDAAQSAEKIALGYMYSSKSECCCLVGLARTNAGADPYDDSIIPLGDVLGLRLDDAILDVLEASGQATRPFPVIEVVD